MSHLLQNVERRSKPVIVAAAFAMLVLIGGIDYLTGFELLFSVFYLLEVGLAAWFVGRGFGLLMSVLSAVVWIGGDVAAGAHYSSPLVPVWNGIILVFFYFIIVLLITGLRSLNLELEARVQQRTQALTHEMAERQRLESELLNVSEREQQRIGHDLHDGLCQHLTATALAGQVLAERLSAQKLPESTSAAEIVALVEEGINMARDLAHGLQPVALEAEGLMRALHQMAVNLSALSKLSCRFECVAFVRIEDAAVAAHLYRIAQGAVGNALRHSKARNIVINLSERAGRIVLTVEDDGIGLPENRQEYSGMGIRIMAHRASIIGGTLSVEPAPTGGTIVTCSLPQCQGEKMNERPV